MRKIVFLTIISILFLCSCELHSKNVEEKIRNFTQDYYMANSRVQSKKLISVNINDLSDFYFGNDITFSPAPHINKYYWIVDDTIEIKDISPEEIMDRIIDGKKNKISHYDVGIVIKIKGFYVIGDKEMVFTKMEKEVSTGYGIEKFEKNWKIAIDGRLPHFTIRESDVPLLLESIKKQKSNKSK